MFDLHGLIPVGFAIFVALLAWMISPGILGLISKYEGTKGHLITMAVSVLVILSMAVITLFASNYFESFFAWVFSERNLDGAMSWTVLGLALSVLYLVHVLANKKKSN